MTAEEALACVNLLTAAFRPREWSAESAQVYALGIMDLGYEEARTACGHLVQTSAFMPVVADIRGEVRRARQRSLDAAGPEMVPDADPDDVQAYLAALRAGRMRSARGRLTRRDLKVIGGTFENGEQ